LLGADWKTRHLLHNPVKAEAAYDAFPVDKENATCGCVRLRGEERAKAADIGWSQGRKGRFGPRVAIQACDGNRVKA
jgi:hypothetical protein